MQQSVERLGRPASPGVAAGALVVLSDVRAARTPTGIAAQERRDLVAAIARAADAIRGLAGNVTDPAGAAILEFQVAMLEDEELVAPAYALIEKGADASTAWLAAMADQIRVYGETSDEYFRARVADLRDLRDAVLRQLTGEAATALPEGAVIAGEDVTPSHFLSVDWSHGGGIALFGGSPSSHVAMLARARGVPMIVGLGPLDLAGHAEAIVDGDAGRIVLSPRASDWSSFRRAWAAQSDRMGRELEAARHPAMTADGVPVKVMINLASAEELDALDPRICDGVGLFRTEFLFHRPDGMPDEETQYRVYRRIAEWAAPNPAVLRTLDAGGDKPIEGLTIPGESNPFLGMRGIRLSLARPDVLKVQLRAMVRAAVYGDVRIMLPMVTVPGEIDAATALLDECVAELVGAGIPVRRSPLGIMVEVPAVAIVPELFARSAFFSIGSNDLTQYVTASARDITAVASINDPSNPAVMRLIANVVAGGAALGRDVSLCGDMGGDPQHLPALLATGQRSISVAPTLIGRAKMKLAELTVRS
jgi:phosphotransferase system enzyme I (PtsI)